MVNGSIVKNVRDGPAVAQIIRSARRTGRMVPETSVTFDQYEGVQIFADSGRICSPVFVASALDRLPGILRHYQHHDLWDGLVGEGVIEFLDKREEAQCLIAMNIDTYLADPGPHTHVEIDPSVIFGPTTGADNVIRSHRRPCTRKLPPPPHLTAPPTRLRTACIPFSDHNQAPRNIYQASMHKQAIAMPMLMIDNRFDVHLYKMNYPTRPLVSTRVGNDPIISLELPSGCSPIVAILCYGGQNQEDRYRGAGAFT
jgi:DNA-directed RNA polymerase II subunit RPB2